MRVVIIPENSSGDLLFGGYLLLRDRGSEELNELAARVIADAAIDMMLAAHPSPERQTKTHSRG